MIKIQLSHMSVAKLTIGVWSQAYLDATTINYGNQTFSTPQPIGDSYIKSIDWREYPLTNFINFNYHEKNIMKNVNCLLFLILYKENYITRSYLNNTYTK